jgi:5'-3' exonuclease
MGIPTFFRDIIESNSERKESKDSNELPVHFSGDDFAIDLLLLDANSMIYDTLHKLLKEMRDKANETGRKVTMTDARFETKLINEFIADLKNLIVNRVRPSTLVYIAFDGVPPRAKMVQQRARRHKGKILEDFKERMCQQFECEDTYTWSSVKISPGTKFMKKMADMMRSKIEAGYFCWKENNNLSIILSDTSVPGEGEHKFMPTIRQLSTDENTKIAIFSPDADLIVLSIASRKSNIYIGRSPNNSTEILKELYANRDFFYLNMDAVKRSTLTFLSDDLNEDNLTMEDLYALMHDYSFLTFLSGNDFVLPLPYLKVKHNKKGMGLTFVMNVYKRIRKNHDKPLIIYDSTKDRPPTINMFFLRDILREISNNEVRFLKKLQQNINYVRHNYPNNRIEQSMSNKSDLDNAICNFENAEYYSQYHPQYEEMNPIFDTIDYRQHPSIWRAKYYETFFDITETNGRNSRQVYERKIVTIVEKYIEALKFTLEYYTVGPPSWKWYYPYDAPPLMFDVVKYMNTMNLSKWNTSQFDNDGPMTAFEQLMIIFPKWESKLLPRSLGKYMSGPKSCLSDIYLNSNNIRLNVLMGTKFIYSEPMLPYIDYDRISEVYQSEIKNLSAEDIERNTNRLTPDLYTCSDDAEVTEDDVKVAEDNDK